MDKVLIKELQIDTVIGVYEFEHAYPQTLLVDLELEWNLRVAGESDLLKDTVDYAAVCERLQMYASNHRFQLIEALAERFAHLLHDEFGIKKVSLTIHKPSAVAEAASVGVQIEREFGA